MFTKLFKNIFSGTRTVSAIATSSVVSGAASTSERLYTVTIPGQQPVSLRAKNQVEVKAMVRQANGLTRLPAGTTVERIS